MIMSRLQCLVLLLTAASTLTDVGQKAVFKNLNYTVDTKYWNVTMWLNDTRLSLIAVAGSPTIAVTTDISFYVNTGGAKGKYTLFYRKHFELCTFLDNPSTDPLANFVRQTVVASKNNHIFMKCPISVVS